MIIQQLFSILLSAKTHLRMILGLTEREEFICLHSKRIHPISEVFIRERLLYLLKQLPRKCISNLNEIGIHCIILVQDISFSYLFGFQWICGESVIIYQILCSPELLLAMDIEGEMADETYNYSSVSQNFAVLISFCCQQCASSTCYPILVLGILPWTTPLSAYRRYFTGSCTCLVNRILSCPVIRTIKYNFKLQFLLWKKNTLHPACRQLRQTLEFPQKKLLI